MQITKTKENDVTVLNISGRLITSTSLALETAINEVLKTENQLILDFSDVDFLASSGIRVLLITQKRITEKQGNLIIRNVNDVVMSVLEMTGLKNLLNIQ